MILNACRTHNCYYCDSNIVEAMTDRIGYVYMRCTECNFCTEAAIQADDWGQLNVNRRHLYDIWNSAVRQLRIKHGRYKAYVKGQNNWHSSNIYYKRLRKKLRGY